MRVTVKSLLGQAREVEVPSGGTVADLARAVAGARGACRLFVQVCARWGGAWHGERQRLWGRRQQRRRGGAGPSRRPSSRARVQGVELQPPEMLLADALADLRPGDHVVRAGRG
jgi:hypothetical protein